MSTSIKPTDKKTDDSKHKLSISQSINETNNITTEEDTKEYSKYKINNTNNIIDETTVERPATVENIGGQNSSECTYWENKYCRLLSGYRQLQKVNQDLEDKLLGVVDKHEKEKVTLMADVNKLSSKLVDARMKLHDLEENSREMNSKYPISKDDNYPTQWDH